MEAYFAITGETLPVHCWVRRHADWGEPPILRRRWFSQQFYLYHLGMIRVRHPRILTVGSSRVGSFASRMFVPLSQSFYRADNMIYRIEDLKALTALLADGDLPRPEVLILGLDHWLLSPRQGRSAWLDAGMHDDVLDPAAHIAVMRQLALDAVLHRRKPAAARSMPATPPARLPDLGAPLLEYDYPVYVDREQPPVIDRVRNGGNRFEFIDDLDGDHVAALFDALRALRDMRIEVVVLLPPFSTETYACLRTHPQHRAWWQRYTVELPAALRAAGFVCIGPATPTDYHLTDRGNMHDGFHCGSYMMSFILEDLVAATPAQSLLRQIDLAHLRHLRVPAGI